MNELTRVLITGASSGIGEGFARSFAEKGVPLLLTARREDRLRTLADELSSRVEVDWVVADLSDWDAVGVIRKFCVEHGLQIDGLVNNAGLGWQGSFLRSDEKRILQMIDVNIRSLVELSRCFLPGMTERRRGFILNVASTAAFQPVPYLGVYAASKSFVLSFTEALHEEVRGSGVKVLALCPGPVATEFQQVAGMDPRFFARSQSVEEVVDAGIHALRTSAAVVRTSWFQALSSSLVGCLPRVVVRRMAAWLLRASGAK